MAVPISLCNSSCRLFFFFLNKPECCQWLELPSLSRLVVQEMSNFTDAALSSERKQANECIWNSRLTKMHLAGLKGAGTHFVAVSALLGTVGLWQRELVCRLLTDPDALPNQLEVNSRLNMRNNSYRHDLLLDSSELANAILDTLIPSEERELGGKNYSGGNIMDPLKSFSPICLITSNDIIPYKNNHLLWSHNKNSDNSSAFHNKSSYLRPLNVSWVRVNRKTGSDD